MPDTPLCGLPHYTWPETVCTEPAGHYRPDFDPHAAPLIIDGRHCGGCAWDEPAATPETPMPDDTTTPTCGAILTGGTHRPITFGPCVLGRGHDAHRDATGASWFTPGAAAEMEALRERLARVREAAYALADGTEMGCRASIAILDALDGGPK